MAAQSNSGRSGRDSATTKTAQAVVAKRSTNPLRPLRSKPQAVFGLARSVSNHHSADSSRLAQQLAGASEPVLVSAGKTTSAAEGRNAFVRQKASEIRILLVTQPGLLADGLARSLAPIGERAEVTVWDAALTPAGFPLPRLIVLDMDAAPGSAADLVARFVQLFPSTPIVAMGSMLDESLMTDAMQAGAKAYLPKGYRESQAVGVLRVVLQGSAPRPPGAAETLRKQSAVKGKNARPAQRNPYGLTRAETEVLSLLCEGLTSFEIAKLRGGREGTVKAHLNKIYPKLGVQNRLGASRIGQRLHEVQQCQLQRAGDQASVRGWLLPHMKLEFKRKGELLFHKGDPGRTLYFIQEGRVALPEIGVEMSNGELFGEIGIFTPAHTRSFTARCETDVKLFCLGADEATRLFFEHPQFAYHVMQLMARRLQADSTRTR